MIETSKPLILITNDDGVDAKGIKELIKAICPLGDVVVVAPDGPRSGMSGAITPNIPLRVQLLKEEDGLKIYNCNGTPVDCVKLAVNEILERKPDMVVSGINHGSNASICVVYSGTMGAAMEGCIFGIPSIGFSLTDHSANADFTQSAYFAGIVAMEVLKEGLPDGVCLNVNIPDVTDIKGIKICTQTKGHWTNEYYRSKDQMGRDIYWLTGEFENAEPENVNSDEWALANGYVSIVPTQVDLTAYSAINRMKHLEVMAEVLRARN